MSHCRGDTPLQECSQSCPTLCSPIDYSLPGLSVHGIFRQEYWSGLSFLSPGDLPHPGIDPMSLASPALSGGFFTTVPSERATLHLQILLHSGLGLLTSILRENKYLVPRIMLRVFFPQYLCLKGR